MGCLLQKVGLCQHTVPLCCFCWRVLQQKGAAGSCPGPCRAARLTVHRHSVPPPWQAASSTTQHRLIPHQSAAHWLNVSAEMRFGSWVGFRQKSFGSALLSGTVLNTLLLNSLLEQVRKYSYMCGRERGKLVAGGICAFHLNCQQLKNSLFKPGSCWWGCWCRKKHLVLPQMAQLGIAAGNVPCRGRRLEFSSPALPICVLQCGCNYGIFIVSTICTEYTRVPFGFRKSLVNKHIALRIWVGG